MKNLCKKILGLTLAGTLAITGMSFSSSPLAANTMSAAAADDGNDDWLHAVGSRLYDKDGNEVWITGANWFGLNCSEYFPHYLYAGDIDDILGEVADRGINTIRFPISTELILSWMNGTPYQISAGGMQASYNPPVDQDDGNGGVIKAGTYGNINKDFVEADGKTLITTDRGFDILLDKCKKYGIKAFIDIHSPHADNSGHNYNLWYGKETKDGTMVTTQLWEDALVYVADKYKDNDTLIGFDLKNEPHGKGQEGALAAKWDGSTDENNWAYAATHCADAILDVNPNALIFIEGVEQSLSGAMPGDYWGIGDRRDNSPYIGAWWGGNFRGARDYPIQPEHGTSQIVYSPHDYGPSVYAQTWFNKDFTEQTLLDDYWYDTWAYINAEDIAPELIGEWGGHMNDAKNLKWMTLLRDYMIKNHINHTFWCLNTNSGDTGGLWASLGYSHGSGTTIKWEEDKYALFEESLWQTQDTGKYIGLDHQIPLGKNNTGLSLTEFYDSYAKTEGSNIDGGTIIGSDTTKPPVVTTITRLTTTAVKPAETTTEEPVYETTTTTSEEPVYETATTTSEEPVYETTTTTSEEPVYETTTTTTTTADEPAYTTVMTTTTTDEPSYPTATTTVTTTIMAPEYPTDVPTPSLVIGDIDLDGIITLTDVVRFAKALAADASQINPTVADLNSDNIVDVSDLSILKSYIVGIIKVIPISK